MSETLVITAEMQVLMMCIKDLAKALDIQPGPMPTTVGEIRELWLEMLDEVR